MNLLVPLIMFLTGIVLFGLYLFYSFSHWTVEMEKRMNAFETLLLDLKDKVEKVPNCSEEQEKSE